MAALDGMQFGGSAAPSVLVHLARWFRDGWRLFRAAPLRGLLLSLFPIAVEALLQLAVPAAGTVLSKLLTPLAGMWALAVLHQRATRGSFSLRIATRQWAGRLPTLMGVALLSMLVFGVQMLVLGLVAGFDQVVALVLLDLEALSLTKAQVALMMASGMLPALPLAFVSTQALLSGRGVCHSVCDSVAAVWRLRAPMLLLAVPGTAMLAAIPWYPWLLLLHLPLALYVGYSAWSHVFGPCVRNGHA